MNNAIKNELVPVIDTNRSDIAESCSPIPADRISELYNGEIFGSETGEIARQRVHWMCSHSTGKTVLDVGCSQGITAILLAREGFVVTGLDSHPEAIAYARNASKQETKAVQARLRWIEGDLWDLSAVEMFDTVVLGEVIEHQALPARFLQKMLLHLNADGVNVLTTPFGLHPHPDHKVSLFPSDLVAIATDSGLQVKELDVVDGYIRMVSRRSDKFDNASLNNDLLVSVTKRATLASQELLFSRLEERSTQLRKKNDVAKTLQKRVDALELSGKNYGEQLKKLQLQLDSAQNKHRVALELSQTAAVALTAEKSAVEAELVKAQAEARQQMDAVQAAAAALATEKSAVEAELVKAQAEARQQMDAVQATAAALAAEKGAVEAELVKAQAEARQQMDAVQAAAAALAAEKGAVEAELVKAQAEARQQMDAVQATAAALAAEKGAVEAKLLKAQAEARQQMDAVQATAAALAAEKGAVEAKLLKAQTQARQQMNVVQAAAAALAAEKSAVEAELLKAQQENEKQTKFSTMQADMHLRVAASLEHKVLASKQTLSFRLGNLLINGTKSPANFLRLPVAIWNIHQDAKKRAIARGEKVIPELAGKKLDNVIGEYTSGGFSAVEKLLNTLSLKPSAAASAYTALARHLQSVNSSSAIKAARISCQIDSQPFRVKWLAFRLFESGVVVESASLLESLPADIEFSISERKKSIEIKALAKLLLVKPQLQTVKKQVYVPVPHSLLYVAASVLPYHTSGYTTRTHSLVRALSKSGIKLTVMTRPGYPWDRSDKNSTPVQQSTQVDEVTYHHVRHPSQNLPLDVYLEDAAKAIAAVAKTNRVTAIHAASNHVNALPALLAARQLGIDFHYEMRGLWELTRASKVPDYEKSERFKLGLDLEAFTAKNADHVYVISNQLDDYIKTEWGVDSSRISILPNCINSEDFENVTAVAPKNFTLGYAGSLVPYEGLDLLIDAVKELSRCDVRIDVKIIGDGESRASLEQQVKDFGLTEQIKFLGKYSPDDARKSLSRVNAICIPRKSHKVCQIIPPIKLVEAMALGKPIIVPDLPVMRSEVNEGVTGYFFKAGDIKDLACVIEICRVESEKAKKIGAVARAEVLANRTWLKFSKSIASRHGVPIFVQEPAVLIVRKESLSKEDFVYVENFRRNGTDGVIEKILENFSGNPRDSSREMLRVGKILDFEGFDGAEYRLATKALEIDRSEVILRGVFWVAQRNKDFLAACDIIFELEKIANGNPTENRKKTLEKLKASPAYLLSVLDLVKPRLKVCQDYIPKRICYVLHNSLPYSSGGYGTRSHGVASGLKDAGYDVIVLTRPGFPVDIKSELVESELPGIDVLDGIEYVRTFSPKRPGLSILEYISKAADAIEIQLKRYKPEVVVAASNHVTGLPALIAARRLGIKFIYEVRGLWEITRLSRDTEFSQKPTFFIQKLLEAAVAKEADHVFTLTEPMREELEMRGIPRAKIDLLPNSCDPSRFVPRKRDESLAQRLGLPPLVPVIGYIGTFVDYEGLDDLASACALLKRDGIEFRLLLVGNENASGQERGPITEQIASIAEAEGFSNWLIMPGRIPHDEVESYYSLLDVCPFPRKPLPVCEMVSPMKPLEALAMEKAVVVSSVRALTEMIEHERTGLVFEKGNIRSMADTFARLIADDELRKSLGVAGRKWVEGERTWRQIGRLANQIIEAKVVFHGN